MRRIFAWCADKGLTTYEIAKRLCAESMPTRADTNPASSASTTDRHTGTRTRSPRSCTTRRTRARGTGTRRGASGGRSQGAGAASARRMADPPRHAARRRSDLGAGTSATRPEQGDGAPQRQARLSLRGLSLLPVLRPALERPLQARHRARLLPLPDERGERGRDRLRGPLRHRADPDRVGRCPRRRSRRFLLDPATRAAGVSAEQATGRDQAATRSVRARLALDQAAGRRRSASSARCCRRGAERTASRPELAFGGANGMLLAERERTPASSAGAGAGPTGGR